MEFQVSFKMDNIKTAHNNNLLLLAYETYRLENMSSLRSGQKTWSFFLLLLMPLKRRTFIMKKIRLITTIMKGKWGKLIQNLRLQKVFPFHLWKEIYNSAIFIEVFCHFDHTQEFLDSNEKPIQKAFLKWHLKALHLAFCTYLRFPIRLVIIAISFLLKTSVSSRTEVSSSQDEILGTWSTAVNVESISISSKTCLYMFFLVYSQK